MMQKKVDLQSELDQIRINYEYEFMAIALVEPAEFDYLIKWKYVSGNLNDRFKQIVLRSGKGVPGIVFKTGKPMFLPSVAECIETASLFNYPIINFEKLTSLVAVPLWHDQRVAGVLLGGFRGEQQVTKHHLQDLLDLTQSGIGELNGKELATS
jgi:nitrogen regulatory protein A